MLSGLPQGSKSATTPMVSRSSTLTEHLIFMPRVVSSVQSQKLGRYDAT